jgi:putative alpha-1,2-mannosidase
MYVGISFISIDQALINLNAEVPSGMDFDQVQEQTAVMQINNRKVIVRIFGKLN